jgi:hypothetical protein
MSENYQKEENDLTVKSRCPVLEEEIPPAPADGKPF